MYKGQADAIRPIQPRRVEFPHNRKLVQASESVLPYGCGYPMKDENGQSLPHLYSVRARTL